MTSIIRIKRRNSPGAAGAPSALASAELAYNEVDNTLYYGSGNSGGQATSILPIAGPGVGVAGGFVNKLRNGTFDVWQRGTPVSAPTGNFPYTADGWMVNPTGAGVTVNRTPAAAGTGNFYNMQIVGAAGVTDCILFQRIESFVAAPLAGKICTVQFLVYSGVPVTPGILIQTANAQDNFSAATIVISTSLQPVPASTWTRVAYTFAMPNAANNGVVVDLDFLGALNGAGNAVYINQADLRATPNLPTGLCPNPPPPELRPIVTELAFCQRYYQTFSGTNSGFGVANNTFYSTIPIFPPMRATPAVNGSASGGGNYSTVTIAGAFPSYFLAAALVTSNAGVMTYNYSYTASAEL